MATEGGSRMEGVNPAEVLWEGFQAVMEEQLPVEQYLAAAREPELAEFATAESVTALVRILGQSDRFGREGLLFAEAVEYHARSLNNLGKPNLSMPLYKGARSVFVEYASPKTLAAFHFYEARVCNSLSHSVGAVEAYDRAIAILQQLVDAGEGHDLAAGLARALVNKGIALHDQDKITDALAEYERAIAILRPLGDAGRDLLFVVLINQGNSLRSQGALAEAVAAYDSAIAILESLVHAGRKDLVKDLGIALMNKGVVLEDLGRRHEAIVTYFPAIDILQPLVDAGQIEFADFLARTLSLLQNAFRVKMESSIADIDRVVTALQLRVDAGQDSLANQLADVLCRKGDALRNHERLDEALACQDSAIAILQPLVSAGRSELANDLAGVRISKGLALADQGKLAEAITEYDRAIAIRQELIGAGRAELASDLAHDLMRKGHALQSQGNLAEASLVFGQVTPDVFGPDARRMYHFSLAGLLWQQEARRPEAVQHLDKGRALLHQARRLAGIDETALEYIADREYFIGLCIQCNLDMSRHVDAFLAMQDGKATLFGDLRSRQANLNESSDVLDARKQLTACLANPPQRPDNATAEAVAQLVTDWRAQSRECADVYLRVWRRDRPPQPTTSPIDETPTDLSAIQAHLPDGWAILDLWRLDNDTIHTFAVTRGELAVHALPFPVAKLQRKFDRLLRAIATLDLAENTEALDDLHAYLFAPLLPWLRERNNTGLYLVPHGFLHALPLHAARYMMADGKPRYLCDDFEVAYLPSSSLLPHLPKLDLAGSIFSLSNPERGTPHALPFAEWEGEEVERRYGHRPNSRFYRGPKATLERTTEWADAAVIHYSGHGVGDDTFAPLSHLRLADDLLLAHDVAHRRPPIRLGALVTLNGCQTSVRDTRAHNESMGLMSAFLQRGAGLVLSTLWSVEDQRAAQFVLDFLEQMLDNGLPATQAMRFAQHKLRGLPVDADSLRRDGRTMVLQRVESKADDGEVSPLLWSAFQLVGRVT